MEHRWHVRKNISLDVQLNHRNLPDIHGKTINISMGGMFVEANLTGISKCMSLDVMLSRHEDEKTRHCHIKAYVIHKNKNGVGLMFYAHDSETFKMLNEVIHGHQNATSIYGISAPVSSH